MTNAVCEGQWAVSILQVLTLSVAVMVDYQPLLDKLDTGNYGLLELTPDEQQLIAEVLRPTGAFTVEQRQYFQDRYLLLPEERTAELEALQRSDRVVTWRQTMDGRKLLSVDLLTDCRPGETWFHLRALLMSLKFVKVLPAAFAPQVAW